ncbi:MAG: DUF362 domain-containing protein [Deltaproteobacteria bacterium]|nr:DUF362 domain-containing protein [Deltaproteobacteria bacterium]
MAGFFSKAKNKMPPRLVENRFMRDGKALVGVAGAADVKAMVREAVSIIGGFSALNVRGKSVLVKPNVVSGQPSPATTNPEVVAAVVKILYEEGASKVYVGDMSAFATLSTKKNMKSSGIMQAAVDNGAEVVVFEDHEWIEVKLPEESIVKTAYVTEWIYRADVFINLPVVKTHRSASYSICLKNFIGCTHLKQRPYLIDTSLWEEIVADFNRAYSPDLNIVDGTVSMIEGGPWSGTTAKTGLIIASGDRVAADAVGLGIIKSFGKWDMVTGKGVWEQKQIKRAIEAGVGKSREEVRLVVGAGAEPLQGAEPPQGGRDFMDLIEKTRLHCGL